MATCICIYIFNMYCVCLLCDIGAVEPLCIGAVKHFVLTCLAVPVLCMYQDGGCL